MPQTSMLTTKPLCKRLQANVSGPISILCRADSILAQQYQANSHYHLISDGVKARAPKAKAIAIKAKAHKAKDKVMNRDQGLRQGHDEPTQYQFL